MSAARATLTAVPSADPGAQHRGAGQQVAEEERQHHRQRDARPVGPAPPGGQHHAEHLPDRAAGQAVQGRGDRRAPGGVHGSVIPPGGMSVKRAARGAGTAGCGRWPGRRAPRSGVPRSRIAPSCRKHTCVATSRAKAISWVASTIVVPPVGQVAQDVEHLADQLGVQRGGDLVEQHQGRVGGQRPGQGGALLLAAGEPVGVLVGLVGQPEPAEQVARPRLGLAAGRAVHPARREGEVVEHGHVREQVVGLEDHPHPAPDPARVHPRVGDLLVLEPDAAVVDGLQQVQAAQQRGLAAARGADQADHVVRRDVEADVAQHHLVAVRLAEVLDPQQGGHRAPARSRRA